MVSLDGDDFRGIWVRLEGLYICDGPFACVVPHQARSRPHRANTGDVDDGSTAALLQRRHRDPDAQVDALDIHREDPVEFVLRHFQRGFVLVTRPCVVDQDVQAAELGDREVHNLLPVVAGCDVRFDGRNVAVRVVGEGFLQAFLVHVSRDHFGAFFDELAHCGETEAGGGSYETCWLDGHSSLLA